MGIGQAPGFGSDFSYLLRASRWIHFASPAAWPHARDRDARAGAGFFLRVCRGSLAERRAPHLSG